MPARGNLRPLSPRVLFTNTAPNVIGYSRGCTDVRPIGEASDWQAPAQYRHLSALGPVYRQFYRVQCTVQYPGKISRRGKPKKVILCWAGQPQPGLRSTEMTPGRPGPQSPLWVSCSCNYFRYVCEWALARYGSADIIYSNGQPARFTNPRGIGTLCKHLYASIPVAISSWSQQAPEERSVEDPAVQEVPQAPRMAPKNTPPPEEDLAPTEEEAPEETPEEEDEEDIRGASYVRTASGLYVPSRLSVHAQTLRSIALPFDSECC